VNIAAAVIGPAVICYLDLRDAITIGQAPEDLDHIE